jgi:hypothetical protein
VARLDEQPVNGAAPRLGGDHPRVLFGGGQDEGHVRP